jgi:hypothetical protein
LETEGKEANITLESFRPLGSARRADVADAAAAELPIEESRVKISLRPCQWVWIECRWKAS